MYPICIIYIRFFRYRDARKCTDKRHWIIKNAGLGGFSDSVVSSDNWDNITKTGIYLPASITQPELPAAFAGLVVLHIQSAGYATQLCMRSNKLQPQMWRRSKDTTSTWGDWVPVMLAGDFGFGGTIWGLGNFTEAQVEDKFKTGVTQVWRNQQEITKYSYRYAPNLLVKCSDSFWNMSIAHATGLVTITAGLSGSEPSTFKLLNLYSTLNTTKASDGALKAASPVVKLFHDGRSEINDESEGCAVERLGVGEYLITGCMGLNADAGWSGIDGGFDIPKDRHNRVRVWLDYEVNADGSILVKTYHCTYPDSPSFAQNRIGYKDEKGEFTETVKNGEPVDIPVDQYLLVRVEMPADSIWNQKQAAIQAESEALHSQDKAPEE